MSNLIKKENNLDIKNNKDFVRAFKKIYEYSTGYVYNANQKDYVIAARLLKTFPAEQLIRKLKIFYFHCKKKDLYFTTNGFGNFTIGNFCVHINELVDDHNPSLTLTTKKFAEFKKLIKS